MSTSARVQAQAIRARLEDYLARIRIWQAIPDRAKIHSVNP